jgi:hypothetical protein
MCSALRRVYGRIDRYIVSRYPSEYSRIIAGYTQLSTGIYALPSGSLCVRAGFSDIPAGAYGGIAVYGVCAVGASGVTTGGGAGCGAGMVCGAP